MSRAERLTSPSKRRAALAELVRSLPDKQVVRLVKGLGQEGLAVLFSLATVPECRCPVKLSPCPCGEDDCDCRARQVEPCVHDSMTPEVVLPDQALAVLLWRYKPGEYRDPPLPAKPSSVTSREAMAVVRYQRRQRGEALWHPGDLIGRKLPEKLGRGVSRRRNGTDVVGEMRIGGDE